MPGSVKVNRNIASISERNRFFVLVTSGVPRFELQHEFAGRITNTEELSEGPVGFERTEVRLLLNQGEPLQQIFPRL